jgi:hypothetical protein
VAKQVGAAEAFERMFGFAPPNAREREALEVMRLYLCRAERALSRRWLGLAAAGREASMATEAMGPVAMRETVRRAAALCDGLLDETEPPSFAMGHPPQVGGRGRAP